MQFRALCLLLLACGASHAASKVDLTASVTACMTQAADVLGFNGEIFVRLGNQAISRPFGTADPAGRVPLMSGTRFNIASAGKMFTAVDIGVLVDRGAIEFDAPISRYLQRLKPDMGAITVAQLLNHTSGMGNYFEPRNAAAIQQAHTATDLMPLALAEPLAFVPGSKRSYSNSGFVVLGAIIEKISGLSYAEFTRREVLQPLDMSHTAFIPNGAAIPTTRMSPAGLLKDARELPPLFLRSSPAGGIYSTAPDIAKFLTALNGGQLVTAKTRSELLMPRADPAGAAGFYGYGFNVTPELTRVGHGGGAPGMNAEVALYLASGRQIIALSNHDPPTASRMVTVLEKALFAADPAIACTQALEEPTVAAHPVALGR